MLKRLAAVLLTLTLLAFAAGAAAETADVPGEAKPVQHYDGLVDKFTIQFRQNVSLRGLFLLTVGGEGETAEALAPLSGLKLDFRMCVDGTTDDLTAFRMCVDGTTADLTANLLRNDETLLQTHFVADGKDLYYRSSLPDSKLLRWPWKGDFFSSLTGTETGNPSFAEPLLTALQHGFDWDSVDAPLRQEIENWLMGFAQKPVQTVENGVSALTVRYVIPAKAVRDEMKTLLRTALKDQGLYYQIRFYLSPNQRETAFSEAGLAYEDRVIDTLPLGEGIRIERVLSARGGILRESLELPAPQNGAGWTNLSVVTEGQQQRFTLSREGASQSLTLITRGDVREGTWTETADGQPTRSVAFRLSETVQKAEEGGYKHERHLWRFTASAAADSGLPFTPIDGEVSIHLYSKAGDRSTTTAEIDARCTYGGAQIGLTGKVGTILKWEIRPMSNVDGAVDVAALTPEERQRLTASFLADLMKLLMPETPAATEEAAEITEEAEIPAAEAPETEEAAPEDTRDPARDAAGAEPQTEETAESEDVGIIPYVEEEVTLD
ncbi:MAG: hypothetical protein IKS31_00230 [Clostridia bacterium]|nr:hypothetical protein [Clostridia bacterium]